MHSQRHLGNTLRLKAPLTPSGLRPRTHSTRLETTDTLRLQEHELAAVVGLPADAEPRPDPRYVDPLDEADAPKAAPKKVAGRVKMLQAIQRATAEVYPIMATLSQKLLLPTRSPFKFFCLRAASLRRYPMRTMGLGYGFPRTPFWAVHVLAGMVVRDVLRVDLDVVFPVAAWFMIYWSIGAYR